jgi:hypothetical protein
VEGERSETRTYPLYGRRDENGQLIEDIGHKEKHRRRRLQNFFIFGTMVLFGITILVNLLSFQGEYWVVYVLSSVIYMWFSIKHTLLSNNRACRKILLQALALSVFLAVIDIMLPDTHALIDTAIPCVLAVAVVVEGLLVHFRKSRWKAYVRDFFVMDLLGYVPIILFLFGVVNSLIPSLVCAVVSFFTLASQFAFSFKKFKDELRRLLHY